MSSLMSLITEGWWWTMGVTLVVGLVSLLWMLYWKPRLEAKPPVPCVPMLPNSHWLLGHLLWLLEKEYLEKQRALAEFADEHGRCACWIGPTQRSLSLTSASDALVLLRNHHTRHSAPLLQHHFEMLSGKRNLLLLNGKEWRCYQTALKSALLQQWKDDPLHLQRIVLATTQTLVSNIHQTIRQQQSSGSSNTSMMMHCPSIDGYMKMITQDVFGLAAFSHDFGCCSSLELSNFAKAFEAVEDDILDRCLHNALLPQNMWYRIPTQRNRNFLHHRAYLRNFLSDIVRERLTKTQDAKGKSDILDKLLERHTEKQSSAHGDKDANFLVEQEDLVDILLSVLLAGYDTVSISLTYAVYLVSKYPEWQELCLEEIRQTTPSGIGKGQIRYPLCRAVIVEALRLYPVATALSRTLEKPFTLPKGNVTVPKGCHVGISVWLIHRSEHHFPQPLEFRPDRWVERNEQGKWVERISTSTTLGDNDDANSIPAGNKDAFFAFSAGARSCPGQSFALEEASLAFAVLLRGLKFDVDPDYEAGMEWKVIVQKPKGGVPATISMRNETTERTK